MTVSSPSTPRVRPAVRRHLYLIGSLLLPVAAHAAPFCLESQALTPQCIYDDADNCRREAYRQGGVCSANKDEVRLTTNVGQYCLVTSQRVSLCIYSDRGTCSADAERQHGTCTNAPTIAPSAAPDPYAAIGGR